MIENDRSWHEILPYALLGYDTIVRPSTGATPYLLIYGNEAVILAKVEIPSLWIIQKAKLSNEEWVRTRCEKLMLIDEKRMVVVCYGTQGGGTNVMRHLKYGEEQIKDRRRSDNVQDYLKASYSKYIGYFQTHVEGNLLFLSNSSDRTPRVLEIMPSGSQDAREPIMMEVKELKSEANIREHASEVIPRQVHPNTSSTLSIAPQYKPTTFTTPHVICDFVAQSSTEALAIRPTVVLPYAASGPMFNTLGDIYS
ncbi:hypothetical protein FXO37_26626 [Capsicum annuum]|nr:hypothetical protein FXO37_26626 [Capsicum annuum]